MGDESRDVMTYELPAGVRVFLSNPDELRFRKGVWSYTEALVNLEGHSIAVKQFFAEASREFMEKDRLTFSVIVDDIKLTEVETTQCKAILDNLKEQGFLSAEGSRLPGSSVTDALLGGAILPTGDEARDPLPILFLSDIDYAVSTAKELAGQLRLPLDALDSSELGDLAAANLTDQTDVIAHSTSLERLGKRYSAYGCVVACFASPRVQLLRNLNRVLLHLEMPLFLGLIDGPFVSLLACIAPQTGCFECFEQRMLARLEDTTVYHKFVESQRRFAPGDLDRGNVPAIHILVSAALSEAFLFGASGISRLAGRCINIYLPLLEIQVEDLLRVGYCPACGYVAKLQMDEMYTSSREIMNALLKNVTLAETPHDRNEPKSAT